MTYTQNTDLLHGSVFKGLILFALPLLGTSFIQLMFSTADILFAGNFIGDNAAAAIGASIFIVYFMITFLIGLSSGASVVISSYFGLGDKTKLQKSIQNAVIIAIIGGMILTILSYFLSPQILYLTNVPSDLFDTASSYIRIYSLSILFTALYDIGFSALRSIGNSKKPFVFLAIGGLANIIMNSIFILIFQMGVEGIAWATAISQIIIVILVYSEILKKNDDNPIRFTSLHFDCEYTKKILRIGVPVALQSMIIILSNILIQSQINLLGYEVMAAFSYYSKIDNIAWLITVAFEQTILIFVSQNLGAGNVLRAREGVKKCMILAVGVTIVISLLIMVMSTPLISLFTHDTGIINISIGILFIIFPFYWIYSIMGVMSGVLKGEGNTFAVMTIILVIFCVVRTAFLYLFMEVSPSITSIAFVYPSCWILAAVCLIFYYKYKPMKSSSVM